MSLPIPLGSGLAYSFLPFPFWLGLAFPSFGSGPGQPRPEGTTPTGRADPNPMGRPQPRETRANPYLREGRANPNPREGRANPTGKANSLHRERPTPTQEGEEHIYNHIHNYKKKINFQFQIQNSKVSGASAPSFTLWSGLASIPFWAGPGLFLLPPRRGLAFSHPFLFGSAPGQPRPEGRGSSFSGLGLALPSLGVELGHSGRGWSSPTQE